MSRQKGLMGWMILVTVVVSLIGTVPVQAQDPTPENDENCVYCHENQYYLYDSGKYFCLCEAPMHCIYCHGGRTDSYKKEIAHEGLVLHPTREHAIRCQGCHTEDYMSRVVKFDSVAGISNTPVAVMTATPVGAGMLAVIEPPNLPLGSSSRMEPWRSASLGLLGLAFMVLIAFAIRCHREDCARRQL